MRTHQAGDEYRFNEENLKKYPYRLLADGNIIDRRTEESKGFVPTRLETDMLLNCGKVERQEVLKQYLYE